MKPDKRSRAHKGKRAHDKERENSNKERDFFLLPRLLFPPFPPFRSTRHRSDSVGCEEQAVSAPDMFLLLFLFYFYKLIRSSLMHESRRRTLIYCIYISLRPSRFQISTLSKFTYTSRQTNSMLPFFFSPLSISGKSLSRGVCRVGNDRELNAHSVCTPECELLRVYVCILCASCSA